MNLRIPVSALVVLIGPSGSGKTTFAAKHFGLTQIVSSDECRALVSDDENDQAATPAAFRVLHAIVRERLRAHRTTVVDATNVKSRSRKTLLATSRKYGSPAVAIVFDLRVELCLERNRHRASRSLPEGVIRHQHDQMQRSLPDLENEGYQSIHVLGTASEVDAVSFAV